MGRKGLSRVLRFWIGILSFYLCRDVYGVTVLDVNIISQSNHTYVLRNEYAVITCDFILDDKEELNSVHWSAPKGDQNGEFYVWRKTRRPSIQQSVFKGRLDMRKRDPHKLYITSAVIEMHGDIRCTVKTTEGSDNKDTNLVIIADVCKETDWTFSLDKETCIENVQFTCTGFYPKPSPNCGLYDREAQKFFKIFPMDRITETSGGTFDLQVSRQFEVNEVTEYEDVVLRCDIIVYGADYKFGIEKEMFGEKGCSENYPKGVNITGISTTCWNRPANGTMIAYHCDGTHGTITCLDGNWVDESGSITSDEYCNGSPGQYEIQFVFSVLLTSALIFFMW